jgi:hypothetical protein
MGKIPCLSHYHPNTYSVSQQTNSYQLVPDFSGPSTVSLMKFSDGWEIIQMDVKIVWMVMDNG